MNLNVNDEATSMRSFAFLNTLIMKRIFLLLSLLYFSFLTSCESDKSNDTVLPTTTITTFNAKINGTDVDFNVAAIVKETNSDYTDLIVTVSKSSDMSKSFVFHLEQMQVGENSCYYFLYRQDEVNYDLEVTNSFSTNVTTNTEHNIVGTFTGRIYTEDQSSFIDITDGVFNITY
jgi:hypothetical protein